MTKKKTTKYLIAKRKIKNCTNEWAFQNLNSNSTLMKTHASRICKTY